MTNFLLSTQQFRNALLSFGALLTEPSRAIKDLEQRRRARLSSALLLTSAVSFILSLFIMNSINDRLNFFLLELVMMLLIYLLSRTRYYQLAAILGIGVAGLPSFRTVAFVTDYNPFTIFYILAWLTFPVLYASLVLNVRATIVTAAAVIAGMFALLVLFSGMSFLSIGGPVAFVGSATGLIAIAAGVRERYLAEIKQNLVQLERAQAALQQAHNELEQRVEDRTAEVQRVNELLSHEIMERELAQQEADIARDQALEALKLKSQILANVSHDARTPLSVIMLRTELMKRGTYGGLNARQREVLDGILSSGNDLLGFIDNLLRASQLDNTQAANPSNSEIVLGDWLDDFAATVKPLADQKALALVVEIADDMPDIVSSDPGWLKHILSNLASNAIKFTEAGAVTICAFRSAPDRWALSVKDTGFGISAEAQVHIFKAFWQVDGSTTRKTSRGVGLGLSIVDNLARLLGGQVKVESELGMGSTFTVMLPLEKVANNAIDE